MKRSFIDAVNIAGTFIVVCIISFAVYTLFVGKPFYKPASYLDGEWNSPDGTAVGEGDDSGTYTTKTSPDSVVIGNVSGLIDIEGWNNDYAQLEYIKRGPGKPPEVEIDDTGSGLSIKAVYPKAPGSFGSVEFFLKVPKNIESIEAHSVSGRIKIEGAAPGVRQHLSSTSGTVSTDAAGDLEISSVSGTITFISSGSSVSASTTSGRIDGKLEKAPDSGKIRIKSVSGRIKLEVPSDLNADVNLHSVSGSVSTDLPVSVTETKQNTIRGVIGSGGTELEISTVSGAIKITE